MEGGIQAWVEGDDGHKSRTKKKTWRTGHGGIARGLAGMGSTAGEIWDEVAAGCGGLADDGGGESGAHRGASEGGERG